jgi:membrane dipeptidase
MVRWISLALLALSFTLASTDDTKQHTFETYHRDAIDEAHKLLRHHPLVDTHNDLPL